MNKNDIHNSNCDQKEFEAERDKENRKRERTNMFSGIILSLATVISSWCAFQSSQWNGEQYFNIDNENIADNKRLQKEIVATQRRAGESNYFLYYLDAMAKKDEMRVTFLEARFPPHLKKAILAWKATDPLNNELAPGSPFQMEEYVVPEIEEAKVFAKQAGEFKKAANQADKNSDNYLLLSIVISMVLFFYRYGRYFQIISFPKNTLVNINNYSCICNYLFIKDARYYLIEDYYFLAG